MRRFTQVALAAVAVVLLAASIMLFQQNRKTTADLTETRAAEQTARNNYAEAFNAIAEIQDSLNAITVGTGNLKLQANNTEVGTTRLTEPSRRDALESIALLGASIQRTKEKIGELEVSLKKSGTKIRGLEKMVANLKETVESREQQVTQLTDQVNSLQTQVAEDKSAIEAKDQTLEERRHELATVSYVIGTKKALAESGVIVAKGGVLGLGKTVQLTGRYDEKLFTAIDTDQETVIQTPVDKLEKVKILSAQPTDSYQLTLEGNQVAIHILNPQEFRKVKRLVIMTA